MIDADAIKAQVDFRDLCAHLGIALDSHGRGKCPLCGSENKRVFVISKKGISWKCFKCDEHGDCFSLVMKMEGGKFPDAVRSVAVLMGIPLPASEASTPEEIRKIRIVKDLRDLLRDLKAAYLKGFEQAWNRAIDLDREKYLYARKTMEMKGQEAQAYTLDELYNEHCESRDRKFRFAEGVIRDA